MHGWEKSMRARGQDDRYAQAAKNPSFSSILLDEIYRSIGEGPTGGEDLKFYGETMAKKQSKFAGNIKGGRVTDEEDMHMASLRRACLIEKWMDKKVNQKVITEYRGEFVRKSHNEVNDLDQDALFLCSTSSSSDSSFGGFSSSDTESIYGARSTVPSFAPPMPKPVRTSVAARSGKTDRKQRNLFSEQRELHMFDDYHYNSAADQTPRLEDSLITSKSRALKIYSNLKKVKQPISPGGKLANFINSLFTTGNTKKSSKNMCSVPNFDEKQRVKSVEASTCSSASSFSRSCLRKHSPSTREKIRNGDKRTVRFYPVSVIVDEDCRPCAHKSLCKEEQASTLMSVSLPTAWQIGKLPTRKVDNEAKYQVMDKSKRVEEMAREFLKEYHQGQKKNDLIMGDVGNNYDKHYEEEEEEEEEDDDALSCSSSDLFELDHLQVIGDDRYCQELPVYETTHVDANRAIANGLIM